MAKDPKGAGRSVSDAIAEIESALVPAPTDKSPAVAPPRTDPEAQPTPEPAPKAPPEQTPRAAE